MIIVLTSWIHMITNNSGSSWMDFCVCWWMLCYGVCSEFLPMFDLQAYATYECHWFIYKYMQSMYNNMLTPEMPWPSPSSAWVLHSWPSCWYHGGKHQAAAPLLPAPTTMSPTLHLLATPHRFCRTSSHHQVSHHNHSGLLEMHRHLATLSTHMMRTRPRAPFASLMHQEPLLHVKLMAERLGVQEKQMLWI